MKIRPLDDRIVVKPLEGEEVTKGGIVLPDSAQEKPSKAKVVEVGPGKSLKNGERAALDVKAGDIIYFGKYAGDNIVLDEEEYKILRESDILAKEA